MPKTNESQEQKSLPPRKTFNEAVGAGEKFYPELPQRNFKELLGNPYLVKQAKIVKNFKSKFGMHDFILILCESENTGEEFTTITSGEVVIARIKEAMDENLLPLQGTFKYNMEGGYYTVE